MPGGPATPVRRATSPRRRPAAARTFRTFLAKNFSLKRFPAAGRTDVNPDRAQVVLESTNPSTYPISGSTSPTPPHPPEWQADGVYLIWSPENLAPGTRYTLSLPEGFKDAFSVRGAPCVQRQVQGFVFHDRGRQNPAACIRTRSPHQPPDQFAGDWVCGSKLIQRNNPTAPHSPARIHLPFHNQIDWWDDRAVDLAQMGIAFTERRISISAEPNVWSPWRSSRRCWLRRN